VGVGWKNVVIYLQFL